MWVRKGEGEKGFEGRGVVRRKGRDVEGRRKEREQFTEFVRAVMVDSRGLWRQFLSLIVGRKRHNILVFSCFFSLFLFHFSSHFLFLL